MVRGGSRGLTRGGIAAALLGPVLGLALLPSNVVATALPLLRTEWAASATEMGWVFAAYQLGYVASVLLLLPLTDRVPAGRVIAACTVATTAAALLFPLLANGVWSASLLRALMGAGLAGVYLPGVRVVAEAAPRARRGLAVSLYVSAFYVGASLSLLATGVLLGSGFDWRGTSVVLGAISSVAIPLAAWTAWSIPAVGTVAQDERAGESTEAAPSRWAVIRHPPIARTIVGYVGHSWELYVSRAWLAAYLAGVLAMGGASAVDASAEAGKWSALIAGLGAVGVWLGGWLSDRWGRAAAAAAAATASGVLSLGFGFLGGSVSWPLLVGLGCVYGILTAADSGVYSTAITELAPPGQVGAAQAAQASLGFMASTVAPIGAGAVLDLGGGFGGAFVLAGAASLLGAYALWPLVVPASSRSDAPGSSPSVSSTAVTTSDK